MKKQLLTMIICTTSIIALLGSTAFADTFPPRGASGAPTQQKESSSGSLQKKKGTNAGMNTHTEAGQGSSQSSWQGSSQGSWQGSAQGSSQASAYTPDLTETEAQEIALKDAGLKAADVDFVKTQLDFDDGYLMYEIDFYCSGKKYDYDIDAMTGEICAAGWKLLRQSYGGQFGANAGGRNQSAGNSSYGGRDTAADPPSASSASGSITEQEALQIALRHAGKTEAEISRLKIGMDYEHGRKIYEVRFHVGWTEYDYDIDTANGDIIKYDIDLDD